MTPAYAYAACRSDLSDWSAGQCATVLPSSPSMSPARSLTIVAATAAHLRLGRQNLPPSKQATKSH
ncbi:hypothetical protein TYRP_021380 [Tyrophagus putrescentiae]|nr:hypothetical protein TYRP_021380 [Tyrophagus putrescentiae]